MSVKISFIIPAYNAEATIKRAVESIALQVKENHDIEILVVENGSADATRDVAGDLQKKYPYVKLLSSKKGVSCARNAGLDVARGEWIFFVDADDCLSKGGLFSLLKYIERGGFDMCAFSYLVGGRKKLVTEGEEPKLYDRGNVVSCRVRMLENPTVYMQVWSKLFKRSIIEDNRIRFNEKLSVAEDGDFTIRYSRHCESICLSPEISYDYSLSAASVMRSTDKKRIKGYMLAMRESRAYLEKEDGVIQAAFDIYVLMHFYVAVVRDIFTPHNKASFLKKCRDMKVLAKKDIFAEAIAAIPIGKFKSFRMLPGLFLKLHLYLLAGVAFWVRAYGNAKKDGSI